MLYRVPLIIFLGKSFRVKDRYDSELFFYKITNGKIVIPYTDINSNSRRYLFIRSEIDKDMDVIPARVRECSEINSLFRGIDTDFHPDYIIIDDKIVKDDILIVNRRYPAATIVNAYDEKNSQGTSIRNGFSNSDAKTQEDRATDIINEQNLNVMSNNPVFLARIHLRTMALSKVNQLLLDFDISSFEADYILKFIETMLAKSEENDDIRNNASKLEALMDSLVFYISILNRNDDDIHSIIEKIEDINQIASYNTLLAKVKTLLLEEEDLFKLTEYENLLFEKKDNIQSKLANN